jgi:hypothetical protein
MLAQRSPRHLLERLQLWVPSLPGPFAGFVRDQITRYACISQVSLGHHRQFLPSPVTIAPEA